MRARLAFVLLLVAPLNAQPAPARFDDCTASTDVLSPPQNRINVTDVFAQLSPDASVLKLVVFGQTASDFDGFSNATKRLATLFTSSTVLTFVVEQDPTCFCSTLRPPSPLPPPSNSTPCTPGALTYCPLSAGSLAFAVSVPLKHNLNLMTIDTRMRILDTSIPAQQLSCVDVTATPLPANPSNPFGAALAILWATVALFMAYFLVIACARIAAAWDRGGGKAGTRIWHRVSRTGFMVTSAISGERLAVSPALLRFCTPSARDVLFHTQWCAALGMVAVQWPDFVYPLLSNTAWSMLLFNVTLTHDTQHWDPLSTSQRQPPDEFSSQFTDSNSALFLDSNVRNTLLTYPSNKADGISSFASAVGLHPGDVFSVSVGIFLCIVAGTVAVSLLVWTIDWLFALALPSNASRLHTPYAASLTLGHKDMLGHEPSDDQEDDSVRASAAVPPTRFNPPRFASILRLWRRTRSRSGQPSFHGSVLHGNLVRLLLLFHLPVTIVCCYAFAQGRRDVTRTTQLLAAFSFAVVSVILPALLVYRIAVTATSKLFEETRTLLAVGPAYNLYRPGSQLFVGVFFGCNLAFGVTLGCGQASGTAQSIIILVIEVGAALTTSIWLPWGQGAHMGVTSFLCCAARIISAVLLVILAPVVSVGSAAGGWVACAIFLIQGLVYATFALMLLVKMTEGLVRFFGGVPFGRTGRHKSQTGLFDSFVAGCASRRNKTSRERSRQAQRPKHPRTVSGTTASSAGEADPRLLTHHFMRPNNGSTPRSDSSTPFHSDLPESSSRRCYDNGEDDEGSIMGAWQPFPQLDNPSGGFEGVPPSPVARPAPQSIGFARVGGGRAHFDRPYAITTPSQPSSFGPQKKAPGHSFQLPAAAVAVASAAASRPSTGGSTRTVVPRAVDSASGRPAGAMPPAHVRTRSQTAVIEDASTLLSSLPARRSLDRDDDHVPLPGLPVIRIVDEDTTTSDSESGTQPRRKWFSARTSGAAAGPGAIGSDVTASATSANPETAEEVPGELSRWTFKRTPRRSDVDNPAVALEAPAVDPARSFVVVRQQKVTPSASPAEPSFKVIRPPRNAKPSSTDVTAEPDDSRS